jgi:hypothetical protein
MELNVFQYQKNLVNESMLFIRRAGYKTKQLNMGKVKLIAMLIDEVSQLFI